MITIEVFGPGCQRCRATVKAVHEALRAAGVEAQVTEIHDPVAMARAGVMFTPVVRVNGEVKCAGRVPDVGEVTVWVVAAAIA